MALQKGSLPLQVNNGCFAGVIRQFFLHTGAVKKYKLLAESMFLWYIM